MEIQFSFNTPSSAFWIIIILNNSWRESIVLFWMFIGKVSSSWYQIPLCTWQNCKGIVSYHRIMYMINFSQIIKYLTSMIVATKNRYMNLQSPLLFLKFSTMQIVIIQIQTSLRDEWWVVCSHGLMIDNEVWFQFPRNKGNVSCRNYNIYVHFRTHYNGNEI